MILLSVITVLLLCGCGQKLKINELKCVEIAELSSGGWDEDIFVTVLINDNPLKLFTSVRRVSVVTVGQFLDVTYDVNFKIQDFEVPQNCNVKDDLNK